MTRKVYPPTGAFGHPSGIVGQVAAWLMARGNRPVYAMAVELLDLQPEDSVLELGFAHGKAIELALARTTHGFVAGVELAPDMVKQAGKRLKAEVAAGRAEFRAGSSSSIPYPDSLFDKVFTVNTVYFWPDPVSDFTEMRRILKDGGRLVVAFRGGEHPRGLSNVHGPTLNDKEMEELVSQAGQAGLSEIRVERRDDSHKSTCVLGRK